MLVQISKRHQQRDTQSDREEISIEGLAHLPRRELILFHQVFGGRRVCCFAVVLMAVD